MLSHSQHYHDTYQPHYRVIDKQLAQFFKVFVSINTWLEDHDTITLAIDGMCGSGKSTLGALIEKVYQGHLFHMDDFFLQPHQRTPERYQTPGENVDHERFKEEVLVPLLNKDVVHYQVFDCKQMALSKQIDSIEYHPINIVEGTYSMHPDLIHCFDLCIALRIDPELQINRITKRNGEIVAEKFKDTWIPLENLYFTSLNIFEKASLIIDITV